jgi:hypothetical protein
MKPLHIIMLSCIGLVLGWAALDHATKLEASFGREVGAGAVDRLQTKLKVSDSTMEKAGAVMDKGADFITGGLEKLHVSAPAAAGPNLQAEIDQLGKDHDALMARVAALEARKECTCQHQAAKVEAPPVLVETQSFGGCANGQCGVSGGRGLFGRRR